MAEQTVRKQLAEALDTLAEIACDWHNPDGSPDPEIEAVKREARRALDRHRAEPEEHP